MHESDFLVRHGNWIILIVCLILFSTKFWLRRKQRQREKKLTSGRIAPGVYEHFKGGRYEVIAVAWHSEYEEDLVIYQAMYGEERLFARPIGMFLETVEVEGRRVPRFRYCGVSKNPPR